MPLVPTNLKSTSEAASILGIDRDAVLMAVQRGSLTPDPDYTIKAPNGKVVAYQFTLKEVERYSKENLGKRGPKPKERKDTENDR